LWRWGERFWLEWLGLDGHGQGWRLLRRRWSGRNWWSDCYRRGRHDWGGDLWEGSGNGDGLRRLWGGRLFGGEVCGRRGGGEFGLEFTHDALQFCELFGVFFGQVGELFAESGLPNE
jgi:hypothetical protein